MSPSPRRVPAPIFVPAPPADLDPLRELWPTEVPIIRVFDANTPASTTSFYAGTAGRPGRFHPFIPKGKRNPLPVLYGADGLAGAISETVFHDVPVRGAKIVPAAKFQHHISVTLLANRDLVLADLRGFGLRRLGVTRAELLNSDPRCYLRTAVWARAIHHHPGRFDGLLWVSRQYDRSQALMLFGDRISSSELSMDPVSVPLPLRIGSGLDAVLGLADEADITITGIA